MTYLERQKYEPIVIELLNNIESNFKPIVNRDFLKDIISFSKHRTKVNKSLLKYNDRDSIILTLYLYSNELNECKYYNFQAKETRNFNYWFKLYILEKCLCSYEYIKTNLN